MMALSRQARIITLLVIDTLFFLVELITGYAVGSLALVADSFHMLNDVLSLVVALYTIKLATSPSSAANSYGWQRAEILGALINGVFLVALCVSIFLEAMGRLYSPSEISNPKVIVIVGCLGLLSNIVGLFLFHEHGHSHGHSHGPPQLPEGDVPAISEDEANSGRPRADSMSSLYQHPAQTRAQVIETAQELEYGRTHGDDTGFMGAMSPPTHHRAPSQSRRGRGSSSRPRAKANSNATKPGANETLPLPQSGVSAQSGISGSSVASTSTAVADSPPDEAHEDGKHNHDHADHDHVHMAKDASEAEQGNAHEHDHDGPDHSHEETGHGHGGHGHSHGSMNMRGVFLHVLGDALGNVGVIAAGLVIWFCHGRWTLYFDPGVSLVITCIIFSSALPLVKSASYILLQGVPSHVSLDAVKGSIHGIPGVVSVHELHVWQLSESTTVASVHVLISPGRDYMDVANGIREAMHSHGIHSVTIQPEFYTDQDDQSETACLIRCPPEVCGTDTCCPPPKTGKLVNVDNHATEGQDAGDGHEGHQH